MARTLIRLDAREPTLDWSPIDDVVMGGVSRSRLRFDPAGFAVFEGEVSLENNGGFASVRTRPMDLAAPGASAYVIEACGDGKRYKLNLRTDATFDGVQYQAVFTPPAGEWVALRLPVSGFRATFRGRDVPGAPPLDPARVRQAGLMIADRQAGPFALAVKSLSAE